MSKQKSHDQLVERLAYALRHSGRYYAIQTHVPYGTTTETIGEIDVLAIGYEVMDFYEVKGSEEPNSMRKAVSQVQVARRYLGHNGNEFIYTPQNGIESLDTVVQRLNHRYKHKRRNRE